jgi:hypothetical protein
LTVVILDVDETTKHLTNCLQFSDTRTYSRSLAKLALFNPSDILVTGSWLHLLGNRNWR